MSTSRLPLFSAQDAQDAARVTSGLSGKRFEIQLGHLCNNRCVFCSSGQLTEMRIARSIRLDPILEAIDAGRAGGATHITFLGGEPTIHKGFLDALKHAVDVGFEDIVIFTNGVMFPVPGFVDKVLAIGRHFEWRISIQGANEAAHVAVTKRADSFRRIVEGLETLQKHGQRVTANLCVNEESYRSLPDFPALVRRYGVAQLHVDMIRPPSTGERTMEYLAEIMPRYRAMAPYIREMLEGFEAWNPAFDVTIGNLPMCVLPEWASRIEHGGVETTTTSSDGTSLETPVDKYAWHGSLRRHLPACEGCVFKSRCEGVFHEYLEIHGDEEFEAVTPALLDELDPTRRNLIAHEFEAFFSLARAPNVTRGWRGAGVVEETRDGRLTARFANEHGIVRWRLSRASERHPRTVAMQNGRQLDVFVDPEVPVTALRTLLDRLREVVEFDPEPILRLQTQAQIEVRSVALLALMLERAKKNVDPTLWPLNVLMSGGASAEIELRSSDGFVRFELVARPRDGRPHVSVQSRTGPGTDRVLAAIQAERLAAIMRGRSTPV